MNEQATPQPGDQSDETRVDFVRQKVENDNASGKFDQRVVTRFPPEPNGFLHIGHAKSICLNFGIAEEYGGVCHLRMDDTDPTKEDVDFVEAIQQDIRWLGFRWHGEVRYASDYFEQLYDWAVQLIQGGKAYVDSQTIDEIRQNRGTSKEPGVESPFRDRSIEENLELFAKMRAGEFADGEHVLRAKIDMATPHLIMRDPIMYRIRHAHHYRQGDDWCLYPMYDFTHGQSDSIEGVTHSICTLEFENNRRLYDWYIEQLGIYAPEQTEFARLNLTHTVMSKRRLLQMVTDGMVTGWDDPRMPTISGMR
ncbi:MAG TPA: glutamine--tRNA ligase, partial [Planctomycetaceae bacterium]|nr:glutamine--tRNA ligase [Planctomycetaceae bacterium]